MLCYFKDEDYVTSSLGLAGTLAPGTRGGQWVLSPPLPRLGAPPTPLHPHSRVVALPAGTHREFDLLGPVGILEGVVSVLVGQAGGADGGDHHRAAAAPDGVLEQAGQLAVPVGHVRLAALGTVGGRGVSVWTTQTQARLGSLCFLFVCLFC